MNELNTNYKKTYKNIVKKKDKYSAFLHWLAHLFRSFNSHLQTLMLTFSRLTSCELVKGLLKSIEFT